MFWEFKGVLGVKGFMTFWKVERVTKEGTQNKPKFNMGETGHLQEGGPKKGQNSIWGKTGHL